MENRNIVVVISVKLEYILNYEKEFILPTGQIYTPVKAPDNGLKNVSVFENLHAPLLKLNGKLFRKNGKKFHVENYIKAIERKGIWNELKEARDLWILYVEKLAWEVGGIFIQGKNSNLISVDDWIKSFFEREYFLQAAVLDRDYDEWQNATDPWTLENAGRSHEHMEKKEFLPGRWIINTEMNPGHRTYKDGYIDMVGSRMWLGKAFWNVIGKNRKKQLLSSDLFDVREFSEDVLEINSRELFLDETTAELQMQLRKLLYE